MRLRRAKGGEKRQGERQGVQWSGRCGRVSAPEWEWGECTIEDTSTRGAKLVLVAEPAIRSGDEVGIAVERVGTTAVGLRLRGIARHISHTDGTTVIGVELVFRTPQELRTAEMLFNR